ncbi:MAG TPA: glycosyltransferase family 2 protein [Bacilli bacterium]
MEVISILIPTYNAEPYIEKLILNLMSQELKKDQQIEIIIFDSSSSDQTVDIVRKKFFNVKVNIIAKEDFDHGRTRNLLASQAKGTYLLFMTQDALPCDHRLLATLVEPFCDPNVMISYARQVPYENTPLLEKFARNYNYPEVSVMKDKRSIQFLGIKVFFNSDACSMYRKTGFEELGGFQEGIIQNEDMIFASKVILNDYIVSYTAGAKVYHSHQYTLKQQFKRYFDTGRAFKQMEFIFKYVSNEKEGFKMLQKQLIYLILLRKYHLIPFALFETIVKFAAYHLGKRSDIYHSKSKFYRHI